VQGFAGTALRYPLAAGEEAAVTRKLLPNAPRSAAYRLGNLGALEFYLHGSKIGSVPLYVKNDPRLLQPDRSSFGAQATGMGATLQQRFALSLQLVLRALFDVSAVGRWE
jgi:D-alanyl-D-alanine carboxypeptidase